MNAPRGVGIIVALICVTSCGGVTTLEPVGPSPATVGATPPPAAPAPAPAATAATRIIHGSVGQREGGLPCFADRYPCEVYDFLMQREGPIEVTLTWDGAPRALFVQLYWTGEGLAHEDVAQRDGPSRISFLRPRMEAARYTIRVVSLEPAREIPFTLALTY